MKVKAHSLFKKLFLAWKKRKWHWLSLCVIQRNISSPNEHMQYQSHSNTQNSVDSAASVTSCSSSLNQVRSWTSSTRWPIRSFSCWRAKLAFLPKKTVVGARVAFKGQYLPPGIDLIGIFLPFVGVKCYNDLIKCMQCFFLFCQILKFNQLINSISAAQRWHSCIYTPVS